MYIEQLYTNCLAEAAYYIESNGKAAIVDPMREFSPYIELAEKRNATIEYIFETHFHADFVSGHVDLANKTGAKIIYGPNAKTEFDAHIAIDEEEFQLGNITIKALHTPGHTPESTTYLLKDKEGKPHCIFTGDTLFIGDVGRPDLAVKSNLTKEDLAGMLFDSLRNKIMPLPNDITVYPAHGAGSACGKNMSSETYDSLGNQKKHNYALQDISKEEFIKQVTEGILPPPQYFPKNAMLNKQGYTPLDTILSQGSTALSVNDFDNEAKKGALIIDTRNRDEFVKGTIPKALFLGLDGSYAVWAGTLIENLNQPILLITEQGKEEEATLRLARVGYDNCKGYLKGGFTAWKEAGKPVEKIQSISPQDFATAFEIGDVKVVDTRKPSEYDSGHIVGATGYPLDFINSNMGKLNADETLYFHCKSGYRSLVALSILQKEGYKNIVNVEGGYDALTKIESIPIAEPIKEA